VMELLLAPYQVSPPVKPGYGPLVYELLLQDKREVGVYLGRHRAGFPGTDALSYGVAPYAKQWAEEAELPELIFGEGARLATDRFLLALNRRTNLRVVHLTAEAWVLDQRRARRRSKQSPAWMKGAETRATLLAQRLAEARLKVIHLDATASGPEEIAAILGS
jgi:hypothetical protein